MPSIIGVPFTDSILSQPAPTLIAVSVPAEPVSCPMFNAFKLTSSSPVIGSIAMTFVVLAPPVAFPIAASIVKNSWVFVFIVSAGVVPEISRVLFVVLLSTVKLLVISRFAVPLEAIVVAASKVSESESLSKSIVSFARSALAIVPSAIFPVVTELSANSSVSTAPVAISEEPTASAAISSLPTAAVAISELPTASAAISSLSTESVPRSAAVMLPSRTLDEVTAFSASSEVSTAPAAISELPTALAAISALPTAFVAISEEPTASAAISSLSTESVPRSATPTVPSRILSVVTAFTPIFGFVIAPLATCAVSTPLFAIPIVTSPVTPPPVNPVPAVIEVISPPLSASVPHVRLPLASVVSLSQEDWFLNRTPPRMSRSVVGESVPIPMLPVV